MLDPHELYELADALPEPGDSAPFQDPVLIQTLTGFVDAGQAIPEIESALA